MPEWRNGRRGGLKIRCQQWRVGSSPTSGTAGFMGFAIMRPLAADPQKGQLLAKLLANGPKNRALHRLIPLRDAAAV